MYSNANVWMQTFDCCCTSGPLLERLGVLMHGKLATLCQIAKLRQQVRWAGNSNMALASTQSMPASKQHVQICQNVQDTCGQNITVCHHQETLNIPYCAKASLLNSKGNQVKTV